MDGHAERWARYNDSERKRLEQQLEEQTAILEEAAAATAAYKKRCEDAERRAQIAELLTARQASAMKKLADENLNLLSLMSGMPTLRTSLANGASESNATPRGENDDSTAGSIFASTMSAYACVSGGSAVRQGGALHGGVDSMGFNTTWSRVAPDSGLAPVPADLRLISPRGGQRVRPPPSQRKTCGHAQSPRPGAATAAAAAQSPRVLHERHLAANDKLFFLHQTSGSPGLVFLDVG